MTLDLSCKRKGAATHGFKIEWVEPEEKGLETFAHFHKFLTALLKSHGLMGGTATNQSSDR